MARAEELAGDPEWIARRTFVELADTLAPGYNLEASANRLAQACVELLGVSGAGVILVVEPGGAPKVAAGSPEHPAGLAQLELDRAEGPGMDCFRKGEPVRCPELPLDGNGDGNGDGGWPAYVAAMRVAGYRAVHAMPLRSRDSTFGAISLYGQEAGALDPDAAHLARALADMATLGIQHYLAVRERQVVVEQLQNALDSRVVIEQAKGIIAERLRISVTDAFGVLRGHARNNRSKLSLIARGVIDGSVEITPPPR